MPFCREIDYDSGGILPMEDKHFADLHFATFARAFIRFVVVWKGQLELQSYPLAHYTNRVHRVN
jgi:hypothetical protein